jgi:hypothetical protein
MVNKLILSSIAIVALTLGAFAPSALAQETATPTPTPVVCTEATPYNGCIAYPQGGLTDSAPAAVPTATPRPTSAAVVSADAVKATANGASIAFTGTESRVLGYAGASLIGFGAIAVAVARRKSNTDLD